MLNEFLSQDFELNEFIDYDIERIEVLQENRAEKMNTLNNISFLSINEKRAELGYSEVDGGDEILMNGYTNTTIRNGYTSNSCCRRCY